MTYSVYLFVFCAVTYALAYAYQSWVQQETLKHELALAEAKAVAAEYTEWRDTDGR